MHGLKLESSLDMPHDIIGINSDASHFTAETMRASRE